MSEKKTLHNVWLIQDKVPIDESADNVPVDDPDDSERKPKYFAGLAISEVTGNQVSRFEPLSAATKVYKNEKGAKIGARMADSTMKVRSLPRCSLSTRSLMCRKNR